MFFPTYVGPETLGNTNGLPEIETTYSVERLNQAQEQGERFLITERKPNPELQIKKLLLRNRNTGAFEHASSRNVFAQYGKIIKYPPEEWDVVREVSVYGRNTGQSQDWGAYIVPEDIVSGQQVYIADLIEDVVVSRFWEQAWYATDAVAIWTGDRLALDFSLQNQYPIVG
ncbi:hypothetical protein OAI26_02015 [Sulfitobacter sp.]|nr:hypothetical protein [Sulfitobacter sp.]